MMIGKKLLLDSKKKFRKLNKNLNNWLRKINQKITMNKK